MEADPDDMDWDLFRNDTYPRLKKATNDYFEYLLSRGTWMPAGFTPDDVIHEAVKRTLDRSRSWKREKCSQFQHLWGCITSIIHCEINKYYNQHSISIEDGSIVPIDKTSAEEKLIYRQQLFSVISYIETQEENIIKLFRLMHFSHIIADVELSERLALPINEVRNLKKRLRRALDLMRAEKIDIA
jgi:hypothetical protein